MQEMGNCQYGNKCKYAHTHKLFAKRADDRSKPKSMAGKRPKSPNIDTDWQNWNEESLDYEDEKMLEKRRLLLQRELAKENDTEPDGGKPKPSILPVQEPAVAKKTAVPAASSSSSSSSSSSESGSSSSSSASSDEAESKSPSSFLVHYK